MLDLCKVLLVLTATDITCSSLLKTTVPEHLQLHFVSLVQLTSVPLHLIAGPPQDVATSNPDTVRWFSQILLSGYEEDQAQPAWWRTARPQSPSGVLTSVRQAEGRGLLSEPPITEMLFYAARSGEPARGPPTPPPSSPAEHDANDGHRRLASATRVFVLPLYSDTSFPAAELTPPSSPPAQQEPVEAVFLPSSLPKPAQVINEPPVKRKTINDTFDMAAERRKKARRTGGESIAAAAAARTDGAAASTSSHRRSVSGASNHVVPLQTRPLSRSPSIASSRPNTARAPSEAPKRSSLARMESAAAPSDQNDVEVKNKELISRVVMAGMRLYGLSQSRTRKARAASTAPTPVAEPPEQRDDRHSDEKFKLVYHQVYKGTCFAFRQHVAVVTLQPHMDALREAVDRLLALFCSDPLRVGLQEGSDKFTPGGRKAFGSAGNNDCHDSPFVLAPLTVPPQALPADFSKT